MCYFFVPLFNILSYVFTLIWIALFSGKTGPWHWLAKLEKQMLQLDKNHTDKCHYKSPLVTRTITIILIIVITMILPPYLVVIFFFLLHLGSKNRHFGRKETVTVSLSVIGCTSLAATLILRLLAVAMETEVERVYCMHVHSGFS